MNDEEKKIPERTQMSIDRYVNHGTRPGHFLEAVMSNDLFDAIGRADREHLYCLREICSYIYNHIPLDAWGSRERVKAWEGQLTKEVAK